MLFRDDFVAIASVWVQQHVPLSVFNGNTAGTDGIWVLDAFDQRQGNTGSIECWSLFIETDQGQSLRFDSTGPVAIADEEFATVQEGMVVNGIATVVIVLVILWLAYVIRGDSMTLPGCRPVPIRWRIGIATGVVVVTEVIVSLVRSG